MLLFNLAKLLFILSERADVGMVILVLSRSDVAFGSMGAMPSYLSIVPEDEGQ